MATAAAAAPRAEVDRKAAPFVSIVLPIRNEADHIGACLERLVDQAYPRDRFEILVVDGRSDDGTVDVVRKVQDRHPDVALRLLDNPDRTVPQALNRAIRVAHGDVIVRLDGHTVPANDYVAASVAALEASGAANVGGVVEAVGATPFGEAVVIATRHPLGVGDAKFRSGGDASFVDTVPFGAFRRAVFVRTGLFDESMVRNQDYEMNVRIRAAGERIYLDPAIRFTYTPRGTVRGLAKQYFEYGWWRVETVRRHPRSLRLRQFVPAAFVAGLVVAALLAPWWGVARFGLAAVLAIYGATLFGVAARATRPPVSVASVALAFAVIHLTWGAGFLCSAASGGRYPFRARPPHVPTWDGAVSVAETGTTMRRLP